MAARVPVGAGTGAVPCVVYPLPPHTPGTPYPFAKFSFFASEFFLVPALFRWLSVLQEDELQMMRSLVGGEGVGGVVRHVRAVKEEIESAEDEARRTYAVSRFVLWRS